MPIARIVLFLVALNSLITLARAQELKQFLNVDAPQTSLHAPHVLSVSGKTVLFGLYNRDGRRDVSALQLDRGNWKPLGVNGQAITGVGGNFLSAVCVDDHGKPWLLTYYTRPSNPNRADRFFLYTLRNDTWILEGPPRGLKANFSGQAELFFLNDQPVLSYRTWDPATKSTYPRLFTFKDRQWIEKEAASVVPANGSIHLDQNQPFLITYEDSCVKITSIENLENDAAKAPQFSIDIPANRNFGKVWFHRGRPAAVRLYDEGSKSSFHTCRHNGPSVELRELRLPDKHLLVGVAWNKHDELLVATNDLDTVRVYRLNEVFNWRRIATAREPSDATIHSPFFALLEDGKPVVTWEAFFAL